MASTTGKTTRSAANKASGSIDTDEAVDSGFSSAQQSHLSRIIAEAMNLQAERLEDNSKSLKRTMPVPGKRSQLTRVAAITL